MKIDMDYSDGIWLWFDIGDELGTTYHIHINYFHLCIGKQSKVLTSTYYYIGNHDEEVEL